ncbi:pyrokinin-1 receptor-like [Thrips palmi]|uniref:Pyrokinin-1 receptor-like n=1 Tax=Thrips palmi TaxID=161013 RepID=A0A6P8YY49_THRPL|nr:pyrokinin-1 receptor-like [Thrips palmi]
MEANATSAWVPQFPPKRDALAIVVPVTVIYVAIFVTGVAGNVVTVIVIWRCRCMHTPTNYYLMSLAVSDLLLLLSGLPQEVYSIWIRYPYPFGGAFCVLRGLAAETSANASVLTITAFTVERYLAICKPFQTATRAQAPSRRHRVFKVIAGVWAAALLCAGIQAMQFGVMVTDILGRQVPLCAQVRVLLSHSFEAATLVFFAAPMTLMCVLYALIASRLHRQRKEAVGHSTPSSLRHVAAKKRVIKMLAAVVTAFFLCWAPFHAQRLVAIHAGGAVGPGLFDGLTYVSGVLHYVSATVNPILYQLMSRKFRQAGKDTLAGLLPNLAWSVRRRASRHHPHGPRCGS